MAIVYDSVQREASMLAVIDIFSLLTVLFVAIVPIVLLLKHYDPAQARVAAH